MKWPSSLHKTKLTMWHIYINREKGLQDMMSESISTLIWEYVSLVNMIGKFLIPLYQLQSYLGMILMMSEECRHMSEWLQVKLANSKKTSTQPLCQSQLPQRSNGSETKAFFLEVLWTGHKITVLTIRVPDFCLRLIRMTVWI